MEVGLGRGHIVLDGIQLPSPQKGAQHPPTFRPMSIVAKQLWIKIPLGTEVGLGLFDIALDGDPAPPRKGAQQPPPTFQSTSVEAKQLPISATAELFLN